ncbi:MAG: TonB-dependent receptor plug domain-containing protein, partial [Bacteroidales bacterium]|nr:TonB-dependent receptor plug domain-containing protein [Bacteroidales bacterium]
MGKKSFLLMLSMLFVCIGAFAQSEVSGVVVSADDQSPIAGVVVSVQGATNGTMTDENGAYFIKADKDATLLFSCLGFKEVSVPVEGRRIVNVSLVQDNLLIDESVVTAVGIQRSERSLGYSVTKVDADEAIQKAEPDLLRALDGKIAGVNVSAPSGDAGGATRITIRGNSSFLGNNQPLYVVDGVPYSNEGMGSRDRAGEIGAAFTSGLSTLDPNDIESMNVLKGAAAAVLYGSRAANGVVVITTKSGSHSKKANKGYTVTYTGSVALETIGALPDYQNKYGQGSNFNIGGANGSWGAPFTEGATIPMYSDIAAEYPGLALELYPDLEGKIPYKAYPNNVKDLFRTGVLSDHSVNLQSVNDKGNFNVTLSYTDQNSYIPGSDFDRYAFSVGGNQQLNDRLRIGGSLAYTYTTQDSPLYGNNQSSAELGGQSSLARAFIMPRSWDIQNFPYQTLDGSNLLFQLSSQAN